jgi:hypothetical protein
VKPINTLRFEEFLLQKEMEAKREEEENARIDFSFHTDDSFVNLVEGPIIRPSKPEQVPNLDLHGLPEYLTSSDEDDGESAHQSMKPKQQLLNKKST